MTDQYFADYQTEMSNIVFTKNMSEMEKEGAGDWIPLSEMTGKVNNRKNGSHGGTRLVSALRQLKHKYLTRTYNLTTEEEDRSELLVEHIEEDYDEEDDDGLTSLWNSSASAHWHMTDLSWQVNIHNVP